MKRLQKTGSHVTKQSTCEISVHYTGAREQRDGTWSVVLTSPKISQRK